MDDDTQHRLTSASQIVARGLDTLGGDLGRIAAHWPTLVGERLARVSTPVSLRAGVLRVRCSTSSWAQAINGMELELLDLLQSSLGALVVTRINARAGGLAPAIEQAPPAAAPLAPLPADRHAHLQHLVASVADERLRSRLLAAAIAAERRRLTRPNS